MVRTGLLILLLTSLVFGTGCQKTSPVWLDDLKIPDFSESIASTNVIKEASRDSILIGEAGFKRGLGVRAVSVIPFLLDGKAKKLTASVGVGKTPGNGLPLVFYVIGDKKILFVSNPLKAGDAAQPVEVALSGIKRLGLLVLPTGDNVNSATGYWAGAKFEMFGNHLPQPVPNTGEKYILTPQPAKEPRINSAKIFGATPGNPFLYAIAASGQYPMRFSADQLPAGLSLDTETGIITGKVARRGTNLTRLKVKNAFGEATQMLKIVTGDTIALTPPMGWNGWNSWAKEIDREKVVASADAMVKMGIRDHGWSFINIDDAWQGKRGGKYNAIQPNEKFPGFENMIGYIHSLGLKAGVYSTPWISSYAGFAGGSSDFKNGDFPDSVRMNKRAYRRVGKYRFENEDARQMAEWGIDFLKYDWRIDEVSARRMSSALKKSGRDIVYSISNSAPFANVKEWAEISNMWRTGPDIRDSWVSLWFSAFVIDKWGDYAGPGHWNDPDMLVLGNVTTGNSLHPTRLTPDEQYSHVTIFSLLAAPLIIGCPVEQLDAFTLNLLTNDEVIEIDQDPLGKPARLVSDENGLQIWLKPMEDGSFAAGLFNTGNFGKTPESYFRWGDEIPNQFTFDLAKAGLKGKWKLRDVWRQKELGESDGLFNCKIPHHGVVLLRMCKI